jgi:hypothetical protein
MLYSNVRDGSWASDTARAKPALPYTPYMFNGCRKPPGHFTIITETRNGNFALPIHTTPQCLTPHLIRPPIRCRTLVHEHKHLPARRARRLHIPPRSGRASQWIAHQDALYGRGVFRHLAIFPRHGFHTRHGGMERGVVLAANALFDAAWGRHCCHECRGCMYIVWIRGHGYVCVLILQSAGRGIRRVG